MSKLQINIQIKSVKKCKLITTPASDLKWAVVDFKNKLYMHAVAFSLYIPTGLTKYVPFIQQLYRQT